MSNSDIYKGIVIDKQWLVGGHDSTGSVPKFILFDGEKYNQIQVSLKKFYQTKIGEDIEWIPGSCFNPDYVKGDKI